MAPSDEKSTGLAHYANAPQPLPSSLTGWKPRMLRMAGGGWRRLAPVHGPYTDSAGRWNVEIMVQQAQRGGSTRRCAHAAPPGASAGDRGFRCALPRSSPCSTRRHLIAARKPIKHLCWCPLPCDQIRIPVELAQWDPTLHGPPGRAIKGVKPDALTGARPVLHGGAEETDLSRPRLVATQLECSMLAGLSPTGMLRGGEEHNPIYRHRPKRHFRGKVSVAHSLHCTNAEGLNDTVAFSLPIDKGCRSGRLVRSVQDVSH